MRSRPELEPKCSPDIVWTLASAEPHWFSASQVCDGGGGLAPPYMWHKRPSAPRLSFLKGWPSHPAEGMQLAVKLQASSISGLESRVKGYEKVQRRHQPSPYSSSFCRGDQIRVVKTVNLGLDRVGQPSLHHPTSQKASYSSLSLQLPRKETKL